MSQSENCENLLIDFNITTVSNEPSSEMDQIKVTNETTANDSSSKKRALNQILCSSQPLYKLLTESNDMDGGNNPFDHFDKQAGLLDDPFEIVENAALNSSTETVAKFGESNEVKTATLISFDSTMSDTSKTMLTLNDSQSTLCSNNDEKLNDSVQNTSQKQMSATKNMSKKSLSASPTASSSTRSKVKNTSVPLLKTVLSNSHLDLIAADNNVSSSDEKGGATNNALQKKQKIEMRRDSGTDDSFDDIWSTIPNLIDSQNEIDVESDIDNDIAKLNIPMLKISVPSSQCDENEAATDPVESIETKALNRSNILEKFASIKQKIPLSPAPIDMAALATSSPLLMPTIPIHNQTIDIHNGSQARENSDNKVIAPSTIYSPIEPVQQPQQQQQQSTVTNNPDSLIKNLQKLVDQCDDKSKQITAMHLLNDLNSILTKAIANEKNDESKTNDSDRQPPKIKRQGTFSIDRDSCSYLNSKSSIEDETIRSNESGVKNETHVIDSEFSQVVKQIQNAFGSQQNINILQKNDQPIALSNEVGSVNPTVIVVMAPPPPPPQMATAAGIDYGEESGFSRFQRSRSQSLTLKERPMAVMRAKQQQQKLEQSRAQMVAQTTPIKGTIGQRRRSFSTITQPAINSETQTTVKPPVNQQPDEPKFLRRRSLHGPIEKAKEPTIAQSNLQNPITRRRSYQAPSIETGIRLPSPKKNFNLGRSSNNAPQRPSATLARRKSFNIGETIKDSPLKIKTSYGIMKKPAAPSASRNLKIRVTQSTTGRSTAPLRAVVPMKQVAPLINDTVAPVDVQKMSTLITSTPRSIPSPIKSNKGN